MIEPYLLNIGLEILKVVGAAVVSSLTVYITLYAKKYERRFQKREVQDEINRYASWAMQLQSFKNSPISERIDTMFNDIKPFVIENNMSISDDELKLMIEKALTMPKTLRYRLLKEAKDELVRNSVE